MESWRERAACQGKPTSWFFPERASNVDDRGDLLPDEEFEIYDKAVEALAKATCQVCPVANDCIRFAVESRIKHGFWGCGGDRRRYIRRLYVVSIAKPSANSKAQYLRAVQIEADSLRGTHRRRSEPMHRCERCVGQGITSSWVPAGVHPEDRNSSGARCGFAVTYARGCRCFRCRLAHSERFQAPRPRPVSSIESTTEEINPWLVALIAA